jgi:hypothetical protein
VDKREKLLRAMKNRPPCHAFEMLFRLYNFVANAPVFDDGMDYQEGDIISDGGVLYRAHTDPPKGTPTSDTAYWEPVATGGGGGITSITPTTPVSGIANGKYLAVADGKVTGVDAPSGGGGLAAVETDDTLSGDGTSGSPLGVKIKSGETVLKEDPDGLYTDMSAYATTTQIAGMAKKYTATVTGDGSAKEFPVTHGLGTTAVCVSVWRESTGELVICGAIVISVNIVTVKVDTPLAAGESLRVVVVG